MKCDNCLCSKTYIKDYEHNYKIKDKEISFISPRRFCNECNNLVYDSELDNKAGLKAIEEFNSRYGIERTKIIELRNKYNLSQELFSKIIGCAKKTLISYEQGKSIPNDNYLIIINSLISKPEMILTLINSNKNQFSEKEYLKIKNRLSRFSDDDKQMLFKEKYSPNEYNGYTQIKKDKIKNLILIIAQKGILKTKLLKEMFYSDFINYKYTGESITGLEYAKLPYGPVPDNFEKILTEYKNNNIISYNIEYINDGEAHHIKSIESIDYSIFSKEEIENINKITTYFENFKSKEIADFSHEEKGYIETEFLNKISYDYAFEIERIK